MILGREKELHYLNQIFEKDGSQILVVYGQKSIGKTSLLMEFTKDRDAFYYYAMDNSERGQLYLLSKACKNNQIVVPAYPENYSTVWERLFMGTSSQKKVIVFDCFEHLVKESSDFMPSLVSALKEAQGEYLVILCSGAIGFVENDLVSKIGKNALAINGFLKIKELKFADLRQYFDTYSTRDCVYLYSMLGGIPGLWQYFDKAISVEENICRHVLRKDAPLRMEGDRIVRESLREPAVYYSILSALADEKNKLNDLFLHTAYSRAKISVYLKNLMELEIVSKVYSLDTPGKENQKKGVYSISNHYVKFWFHYIYPNISQLHTLSEMDFYKKYIEKSFAAFCQEGFSEICRETMSLWNETGIIKEPFERVGCFEGKQGKIDFIGQLENGDYIVAFSNFENIPFSRAALLQYIQLIQSARVEPIRIYLFLRGGYDEEIALLAKTKQDFILIDLQDI